MSRSHRPVERNGPSDCVASTAGLSTDGPDAKPGRAAGQTGSAPTAQLTTPARPPRQGPPPGSRHPAQGHRLPLAPIRTTDAPAVRSSPTSSPAIASGHSGEATAPGQAAAGAGWSPVRATPPTEATHSDPPHLRQTPSTPTTIPPTAEPGAAALHLDRPSPQGEPGRTAAARPTPSPTPPRAAPPKPGQAARPQTPCTRHTTPGTPTNSSSPHSPAGVCG
jgi:hypothetical protein